MSRKVENYKNEICEKCGEQAIDKFQGQYICADCLNPEMELSEDERISIIFRRKGVIYPETHNRGEPTVIKRAYREMRKKVPISDWNFWADIEKDI